MRIPQVALWRCLQQSFFDGQYRPTLSKTRSVGNAIDMRIDCNSRLSERRVEYDICGFPPHTWQCLERRSVVRDSA